MKFSVLILLIILAPLGLFSFERDKDSQYSRGKIFLLNGDTVPVYVKSVPIYNMQSGIQYLDTIGNKHSLIPSMSKGFCLMYKNDTVYFESRKDLKFVLFTSKKSKSSFIYRISNGKIPLYYFVEKGLKMDGIDQVTVELPRYMILLDQEWYSLTKRYFVSDFKKLVSNLKGVLNTQQMDGLYKEVEDEKYKFDNTRLVIEKLNKIPAFVD